MFLFDDRFAYFHMFGFAHLLPWLILVLMIVVFSLYGHRINPKLEQTVRRVAIVIALFMEWTYYIWELRTHGFTSGLLPLGLCGMTLYLSCFMLWTKNQRLFQWIFVYAVSGALLSLIVVDMGYTIPHFRYFHYFGNHLFFLLASVYAWIVWGFNVTHKHILQSSLALFIYALIMMLVNRLFQANFLFLQALPVDVAWLYEAIFGRFWVAGFMLSIFLLFNIFYVFIMPMQKVMGRRTTRRS